MLPGQNHCDVAISAAVCSLSFLRLATMPIAKCVLRPGQWIAWFKDSQMDCIQLTMDIADFHCHDKGDNSKIYI